jgi:hypothetical protein
MPVVAVTQGAAAGLPVAAASNQRCIENKRRKAPYHHEILHVAQRVSQSPMPACIARSMFATSHFFRCNAPCDAVRSLFKPGEALLLYAFSVVFTSSAHHVLSFVLEDATVPRFQRY